MERKWQKCPWDVGVLFCHLYFWYTDDCRNLCEHRHILKFTDYVGNTSLLLYKVTRESLSFYSRREWRIFCTVMCPDQRKQPNYQLWSRSPISRRLQVFGSYTIEYKGNILCPLWNESQQSLCILMRTENPSFSPTSPIKQTLESSSVACFETCERQRKLSV